MNILSWQSPTGGFYPLEKNQSYEKWAIIRGKRENKLLCDGWLKIYSVEDYLFAQGIIKPNKRQIHRLINFALQSKLRLLAWNHGKGEEILWEL